MKQHTKKRRAVTVEVYFFQNTSQHVTVFQCTHFAQIDMSFLQWGQLSSFKWHMGIYRSVVMHHISQGFYFHSRFFGGTESILYSVSLHHPRQLLVKHKVSRKLFIHFRKKKIILGNPYLLSFMMLLTSFVPSGNYLGKKSTSICLNIAWGSVYSCFHVLQHQTCCVQELSILLEQKAC